MDNGGGVVTIREVYALVQQVRSEILGEFSKLEADQTSWRAQHDKSHANERTKRWQVAAWAVTTVITAAGVLVAIWASVRP